MSMSASSFTGSAAQAVPRYVHDLRPSADAAATKHEDRPATAVAIAPVEPPSPTQAAAVSRSMVTQADETDGMLETRVEQTQRTLKPYGVVMLPRTEAAEELDKQHPGETETPVNADTD